MSSFATTNKNTNSSENLPLPNTIGVRDVMVIAWPIMVSMLSFTVMNFVNALWVGPLGKEAFAAVGLGAVLLYAVHGFGLGALAGLKIAVSQAHGEGDDEKARRLLWQGLRLAAVMGLAELAFIPLGRPLLEALGASHDVAPLAADYFTARVVGAVPAFLMTALTQYLQGRSRTRAPMVAMIVANLLNVGLDPLLINGSGGIDGGVGLIPAMGVAGAGIAASISFAVGGLFLLGVTWRELKSTARTFERALFARIWNLGFPLAGRATLEIASYLLFQGVLASVGDAHLAAHVLVVRTISISFLPGYAVSEAVAVLVGQAVGARRLDLVASIRRSGLTIAVTFMCAWGVVFVLWPEPLAAMHSASIEVKRLAVDLFMVSAIFQVADAFAMTALGILNGAGDTRFVLYATVSIAWCAKLPLGWALATHGGLGAVGAWWGIVAEAIVLWAVVAWRVRSGAWRRAAEAAQAARASEDVQAEAAAA